MANRHTQCYRPGRTRRNWADCHRICSYAYCSPKRSDKFRFAGRRDKTVPTCYTGCGNASPLGRIVLLLQRMLPPTSLFGLRRSRWQSRSGRCAAALFDVLCTLLCHPDACRLFQGMKVSISEEIRLAAGRLEARVRAVSRVAR